MEASVIVAKVFIVLMTILLLILLFNNSNDDDWDDIDFTRDRDNTWD